jgi:protein-tyrosine-phosphatase
MAEGLARATLGDRVRIQSAGTKQGRLHPIAVQATAEIGIDICAEQAKRVASSGSYDFARYATSCGAASRIWPSAEAEQCVDRGTHQQRARYDQRLQFAAGV